VPIEDFSEGLSRASIITVHVTVTVAIQYLTVSTALPTTKLLGSVLNSAARA